MVLIDRITTGVYNYYSRDFTVIVDPTYTDLFLVTVSKLNGDIIEAVEVRVIDFNYDGASEELYDVVRQLINKHI